MHLVNLLSEIAHCKLLRELNRNWPIFERLRCKIRDEHEPLLQNVGVYNLLFESLRLMTRMQRFSTLRGMKSFEVAYIDQSLNCRNSAWYLFCAVA